MELFPTRVCQFATLRSRRGAQQQVKAVLLSHCKIHFRTGAKI